MSTIYLVCGKARSGKDTLATILKRKLEENSRRVIITRLAKNLKLYTLEMSDWDGNKEEEDRSFIQYLGTEIIRTKLKKEDFLVKRMLEDIEIFSLFYDDIIIPDVRMQNEIESFEKLPHKIIKIHIERPDFQSNLTTSELMHTTENNLDEYNNYDYIVINDKDLESLEEYSKMIIKEGMINNEKNDN